MQLDYALALAEQGIRVFPLSPNSKIPPKDFAWKAEATTDPDKIRGWWQENPRYNLGVAGGHGIVIVDADCKPDKKTGEPAKGLESLDTLFLEGMPCDSFQVSTPSGGEHLYLRTDENYVNSIDSLPDYPGIDIRSEGGYVVGPGSTLGGAAYEVSCDKPLAPMPKFFSSVLRAAEATHKQAKTDVSVVDLDKESNVARAIEYLVNRAPEAIEGAGGNGTTFKVAAILRGYAVSEGVALELMLEHWNEQKAFPAWAPDELQDLIGNAYRYATGTPGAYDPLADFIDSNDEVSALDEGKRPPSKDLDEDWARRLRARGWEQEAIQEEMDRRARARGEDPGQRDPSVDSAKKSRFTIEKISDLRKLPETKWLIENWIPENSSGILYGSWGSGKSFIAFDMALHLAYGKDNWHGETLPGTPAKVLFVAREGHQGFVGRAEAFRRHHKIESETDNLDFMRSPVNFTIDSEYKAFEQWLRESGNKYSLVIIDTVARVMAGADMGTPESVTKFMDRCERIGRIAGGTSIGVHHANKGGAIMGSVYFEANSDFVFEMKRKGDDEKPLSESSIKCTKQKDGRDNWSRLVKFKDVDWEENGEPKGSLVVAELDSNKSGGVRSTVGLSPTAKILFDCLTDLLAETGKESIGWDDWVLARRRIEDKNYAGPLDDKDAPKDTALQTLRKRRKALIDADLVVSRGNEQYSTL